MIERACLFRRCLLCQFCNRICLQPFAKAALFILRRGFTKERDNRRLSRVAMNALPIMVYMKICCNGFKRSSIEGIERCKSKIQQTSLLFVLSNTGTATVNIFTSSQSKSSLIVMMFPSKYFIIVLF